VLGEAAAARGTAPLGSLQPGEKGRILSWRRIIQAYDNQVLWMLVQRAYEKAFLHASSSHLNEYLKSKGIFSSCFAGAL
jgi:hypothetical protein